MTKLRWDRPRRDREYEGAFPTSGDRALIGAFGAPGLPPPRKKKRRGPSPAREAQLAAARGKGAAWKEERNAALLKRQVEEDERRAAVDLAKLRASLAPKEDPEAKPRWWWRPPPPGIPDDAEWEWLCWRSKVFKR